VLLLSGNFVPQETVVGRVLDAFAAGDLIEQDYIAYDTKRGWHQYNDCNILQMISNQDSAAAGRALGPWLYMADWSALGACRTLRELVTNERHPISFVSQRYTRYWHGYIPAISGLMTVLEISTIRSVMRASVYAAVVLLMLVGVWDRRFFPLTFAVASGGALFWGLPYFGQGMSHAFVDTAVMLGIAGLIFWHRVLGRSNKIPSYCAMFGAVVVYFEMLTGPLPTGAGLLFTTIYIISRIRNGLDVPVSQHFGLAVAGLIAFTLGATLTVITRLLVAVTLVEPSGINLFLGNLELYSRSLGTDSPFPSFVHAIGRLLKHGEILTYGNSGGMIALYTSSMIAWVGALCLAWRGRFVKAWADFAAFLIGASSIVVWCFILPTHTFTHAAFMARILIVPLSLGWAALHWQLGLKKMIVAVAR
jgi:hypothetical protein